MSSLVWVVLGDAGDWSERTVFVSGVFESELEAQEAVKAATLRRNLLDQWEATVSKAENVVAGDNKSWGEVYDEALKKIIETIGPSPPYERGERFKIRAVQIGEWVHGEDARDWFDEDDTHN